MKNFTVAILFSLLSFSVLAEDAIKFLNKTCSEWNKLGKDDSLVAKMEGKTFSLTGKFDISYHEDQISYEDDKYFLYTLDSGTKSMSFKKYLKNKNEITEVLSKKGKNMTLNVKVYGIESLGITTCFISGPIANK